MVNPFAADAPNALGQNLDVIMEALAERFGGSFAPLQIGGVFGLKFRGQFYPHKYLYQVYVACRLRDLSKGGQWSCLEVGGGMGFLAYAALLLGAASDFCVIDLPLVNVLQGYVLLNSLYADHTVLYGEATDDSRSPEGGRVRILPDVALAGLPAKSFDIAVNQDSLPEMDADTMATYLREIRRTTRTYLLSINHESTQVAPSGFRHGVVREAALVQPGYSPVYRMPYWLCPGYVEELFRLT
jgi:putative sugar O-methyltransferase